MNVSLSKEDALTRFKVKVTDELVNNEIELGKKRFGHSERAEKMTPDAFLKGDIQELDENGEEKEKGLKTEGVTVYPMYFRVEEQRALFDDKCVGDTVVFNPYEATDGSETELEYMLKVDRLDVVKYKGNFKFTIKEIQAFVPSNVDKMFFMQMLEGRKDVEDEETFRKELAKIMESRFEEQSQAMLEAGARKLLIEKAGDLPLSVDFFKRLAKSKNEKLTDEQANEHIPEQMDTIKWSIVRGHIQEDINVKIDQKDIIEEAKKRIATQFKMIGIPVEDDKALEDRALKLLKGGEFTEELASGILDRAIGNWAIEQVTVKDEEVLPERFLEEFAKLGNLAL
ncbi:MAG TPA: hypothetical protein DDY68_04215 [Porphyromonadaceae bacterium]|nr:hypothetical protein [Porphyromonadaceae bacterium]